MCKYPDINVELVGQDGNAFAILGRVKTALTRGLREQGMSSSEINTECNAFMAEAMSGDYDNLLQTCMKWVSVDEDENENDFDYWSDEDSYED